MNFVSVTELFDSHFDGCQQNVGCPACRLKYFINNLLKSREKNFEKSRCPRIQIRRALTRLASDAWPVAADVSSIVTTTTSATLHFCDVQIPMTTTTTAKSTSPTLCSTISAMCALASSMLALLAPTLSLTLMLTLMLNYEIQFLPLCQRHRLSLRILRQVSVSPSVVSCFALTRQPSLVARSQEAVEQVVLARSGDCDNCGGGMCVLLLFPCSVSWVLF